MTNLLDKLTNSMGGAISSHNTSNTAHEDIRQLIGSNPDNKIIYTVAYDLMGIYEDINENLMADSETSVLYSELFENAFINVIKDNTFYNIENTSAKMVSDDESSMMEFYFEVDEEFTDDEGITFLHLISYQNTDNKNVFSKEIPIVENQYRYEITELNKENITNVGGGSSGLEDELDTALSLELNKAITIQCKDTDDNNITFPTLIFDGENCTYNNDVDYYIVENVTDGEHSISGGQDVTFHNSLQEAIDASNPISNIIVSEGQKDFIIYRRVHSGR